MFPAETGLAAWLRYAPLSRELRNRHKQYNEVIALDSQDTSPVCVAATELQDGLRGILGQEANIITDASHPKSNLVSKGTIVIGTLQAYSEAGNELREIPQLEEDGFWLNTKGDNVRIIGQNKRAVLYGAFEFLSLLAQGKLGSSAEIAAAYNPSAPIRYTNEWDNLDGSIERGYGGKSIFFKDGLVVEDLTRVRQYARLLSSIRLNGCVVNNVNSSHSLLSPENLKGLGRIADTMRPYGVRIGVSLYFDTPRELAGLPTSDPLDPAVVAFWADITAKLYEHVPDLIGYTIKANSEGQPGPLTYGRTLADAANMFARALKPHGDGIVMYRAFVYNHHLDESKWENDRANAAVEYFADLDDEFDDNVLVQIKFGPIDFQIREPPSPLFAHLHKTGMMAEFMVCQEYLGQQSHYVYMAPEWKTVLDFDFRIDGKSSLLRDVVSTGTPANKNRRSGFAAVVNVGNDQTWLGHHLSMSNLYAYGRLCWSPSDDAEAILQDWIRLTFNAEDKKVLETITKIGMNSWPTYENYSGNLGIQTLCDIIYTHYGPSPGSQDGNGWGQWTRANKHSIGMDRTVATGTGNAGQYPPEVAAVFESLEKTPDELLLWFHHVPYTHILKSGKTVIQHFYDAHYEGAAMAQTFGPQWAALKGLIDDARFEHVEFKLAYQAGHALVWRDSVCEFYRSKCGIADEKHRVGNHPWRIEAEDMHLDGYHVVEVTPAEAASGGRAIVTVSSSQVGTATTTLTSKPGIYDIAVNYYDHLGGRARYEVFLNDKLIGKWCGDLQDHLGHDFSEFLDGHSATRTYFRGVQVNHNDVLRILGYPDGTELAPLDYVSVLPQGQID